MSRILRNKKFVFIALLLILSTVMLFTVLWPLSVVLITLILLKTANSLLLRYNYKSLSFLHGRKEIRKINCIVIGDVCSDRIIKEHYKGNVLTFQIPDRSLEASIQIFWHIESLLEENDRLILVYDKKHVKGYSLFDLPYFNTISQKELALETLENKRNYPLFYEPIRSIKILLGIKNKKYEVCKCPDECLTMFCKDRGIELICLTKLKQTSHLLEY